VRGNARDIVGVDRLVKLCRVLQDVLGRRLVLDDTSVPEAHGANVVW